MRTMYSAGTAQLLAREMQRYQMDILGVSESRWNGSGRILLTTGETVFYSGDQSEQARHERGVAFICSQKATRSVMSWQPISDRIIQIRLKSNFQNVTVINVYAPTNEAEDYIREEFYEQLQQVFNEVPKKDIIILLGDLNAKVGSDNKGKEECMGTQGLGNMNENGELFSDFCNFNELIIGGTIFKKKNIHKATWVSPDQRTANQIDHIAISKKWRKSLQDVTVKRGAEIGSDHFLVCAEIKLKLAKIGRKTGRIKFNTDKLKDENIRKEFIVEIRNRFARLETESEETLEMQWGSFKNNYIETAEKVLGRRKVQRKEWIKDDTLEKVEERRMIKQRLLGAQNERKKEELKEEFRRLNSEVKRSARRNKREYTEDLARDAEEAARNYDMKTLYQITKKLGKKNFVTSRPIKSKTGENITGEQEQIDRWIEFIKEMFNKPTIDFEPDIENNQKLPINTNPITKIEIKQALKSLKKGKAAGSDAIPAELLTADLHTTTEQLHKILSTVWKEEQVPDDWKRGVLIKLPKKGDLSKCENWRGITLLSVASKILTRTMLERMKKSLDQVLRTNQAGFRARRSCSDHIITLRNIIEQSKEYNSKLYLTFIDFERAFDSLDRSVMWRILESYGLPKKFLKIIQTLYDGFAVNIEHNGQLSEPVEITAGVRQGCIISPTLFLIIIDWIMKKSSANTGIPWKVFQQLEDLEFADDICILSNTQQKMQNKVEKLNEFANKTGLKINVGKTKLMVIGDTNNSQIKLHNNNLEKVNKFNYLGSMLTVDGGTDEDIKTRIGKAQGTFTTLKTLWNSRVISTKTKLKIFNSNVKSVLLYGAESWRNNKQSTNKVQTFINKCLRKILKIYWPNTISNKELWAKTNQEPIVNEITKRKWRWIGHTLRKDNTDITKEALEWTPQGQRKRGRPPNNWRRTVHKEASAINKTWAELKNEAKNRVRWRGLVAALSSLRNEEG